MLRKGDSAVDTVLLAGQPASQGRRPTTSLPETEGIRSPSPLRYLDIFPPTNRQSSRTANWKPPRKKIVKSKLWRNTLADSNIHATKTEKGTYIVIKDPGNGPAVDTGKQVVVHYTGKLFPSVVKYSEIEYDRSPGNEPLRFSVIGQHMMIPGMEDGVRQLHQGGKGTIYIPAFLGYDQRPGPGHTAYENLIFEVVVDSVRNAPPPQPTRPGMPMPQSIRPGTYPARPGGPQPTPHK